MLTVCDGNGAFAAFVTIDLLGDRVCSAARAVRAFYLNPIHGAWCAPRTPFNFARVTTTLTA